MFKEIVGGIQEQRKLFVRLKIEADSKRSYCNTECLWKASDKGRRKKVRPQKTRDFISRRLNSVRVVYPTCCLSTPSLVYFISP